MAEIVTDTSGNQILTVNQVLTEATESGVFVIRFRALSGYKLTAALNSTVSVLARKTASGASFQNIASSPIDLTPFANTTVDYDVKVSVGNVSTPVERFNIPVRITPNV